MSGIRSACFLACSALLGSWLLLASVVRSIAFATAASDSVAPGSRVVSSKTFPRPLGRSSKQRWQQQHRSSAGSLAGGYLSDAACLGLVGAAMAAMSRSRAKAVCRNAFGSSSSSFMGSGGASSWGVPMGPAPGAVPETSSDWSVRQGVASMGMRAQAWWVTSNGFDDKPGKWIFDWKKREVHRRELESFLHDVDSFEMTMHNLTPAPGSHKKKKRRNGRYQCNGRSMGHGWGRNTRRSRGKGVMPLWWESSMMPWHLKIPKLKPGEKRLLSGREYYTCIDLAFLNACNPGEEVDYDVILMKGLPVPKRGKMFPHIKIKAEEDDELTVENLTVYAHAFDPAAREKIEEKGGKCVRLDEETGLPIDQVVPVFMEVDEEVPDES